MKDNKRYFYIQAQKKKNALKALNGNTEELVNAMDNPTQSRDLDVYFERNRIMAHNAISRTFHGKTEKLPQYFIPKNTKRK